MDHASEDGVGDGDGDHTSEDGDGDGDGDHGDGCFRCISVALHRVILPLTRMRRSILCVWI